MAAAVAGVFLLQHWQILPRLDPLWQTLIALVGLLGLMLTAVSVARAAYEFIQPGLTLRRFAAMRRAKAGVRSYIGHMTDREKQILGYLLERNQKTITADSTGGYASVLVAKGLLVCPLKTGQVFDPNDLPFEVPNYVWNILVEHRDQFPTGVSDEDGHPWRKPWGV